MLVLERGLFHMLTKQNPEFEHRIKSLWNNYYTESQDDTILKDKALFEMEISVLTQAFVDAVNKISYKSQIRVLELGSGTGILAESLLGSIPEKHQTAIHYIGVDFSEKATTKAINRKLFQTEFIVSDFLDFLEDKENCFDIVITQRSIMAIVEPMLQRSLLMVINKAMSLNGIGIFSEGTRQGIKILNTLRQQIGVKPIEKIWHCLYVDENEVLELFNNVTIQDYASLFWLITRVVYPYFEKPQHNTLLHKLAAKLPQGEGNGLVKLFTLTK